MNIKESDAAQNFLADLQHLFKDLPQGVKVTEYVVRNHEYIGAEQRQVEFSFGDGTTRVWVMMTSRAGK